MKKAENIVYVRKTKAGAYACVLKDASGGEKYRLMGSFNGNGLFDEFNTPKELLEDLGIVNHENLSIDCVTSRYAQFPVITGPGNELKLAFTYGNGWSECVNEAKNFLAQVKKF